MNFDQFINLIDSTPGVHTADIGLGLNDFWGRNVLLVWSDEKGLERYVPISIEQHQTLLHTARDIHPGLKLKYICSMSLVPFIEIILTPVIALVIWKLSKYLARKMQHFYDR